MPIWLNPRKLKRQYYGGTYVFGVGPHIGKSGYRQLYLYFMIIS